MIGRRKRRLAALPGTEAYSFAKGLSAQVIPAELREAFLEGKTYKEDPDVISIS